VAGKVTELQV